MKEEVNEVLALGRRGDRPETTIDIPVFFTVVRNDNGVIAYENCPVAAPVITEADMDAALLTLSDEMEGDNTRLNFYRLGAVNYINWDPFGCNADPFILNHYSYVRTALNVYIRPSGGGFALMPGQALEPGTQTEYNSLFVQPSMIHPSGVQYFLHEAGHNFGLMHTFGFSGYVVTPFSPPIYYRYPVVFNQEDHPYSGPYPRELVIRVNEGPNSTKEFTLKNCPTAGDLMCDTEADTDNGAAKQTFPMFDPTNIQNCLQSHLNCISGAHMTNCVWDGTYRDYNGDPVVGNPDNFMSYYYGCANKFSDEQKMRIELTYNNYWSGKLNNAPINIGDYVEFKGTSTPMKNVVIQWRHNGTANFTNSCSGLDGKFQGILYGSQVRAKVWKLGSDKKTIIFQGAYTQNLVDEYTYSDWTKDVTTFDLYLIQKHLIGLKEFDNGYDKIAADANKSNSLTTFDIVELRKLILGIHKKLPNFDAPWRFVPEYIPQDYATGFNYNPFQITINGQLVANTPYTEPTWEYEILNGANGKSGYDGIKIGDVSSSAQIICDDEPPSLEGASTLLLADETYLLNFMPSGFDSLVAFQLGLFVDHEKLEVLDIEAEHLPAFSAEENVGWTQLEEDQLALSWFKLDASPLSLPTDSPMFVLKVKAKELVSNLESALNLHHPAMKSAFYEKDGCESPIALEIIAKHQAQGSGRTGDNSTRSLNYSGESRLIHCYPNPVTASLGIHFENPVEEEGRLFVTDIAGRVLHIRTVNLTKGVNSFLFPAETMADVPAGVYQASLITASGTSAAKFIKQ